MRRHRIKKRQTTRETSRLREWQTPNGVEVIVGKNETEPLIGIVFPRDEVELLAQDPPDSHGNLYMDAAEELGMTVFIFHLSDADAKQRVIRGWSRQAGEWFYGLFPWPDIFYDRLMERVDPQEAAILDQLYASATPINAARSLGKWACHRLLVQYPDAKPYLPDTIFYQHPIDLHNMLARHAAVLAKPEYGSGGKGISKVWRMESGRYGWQDAREGTTLEELTFIQAVAQVKAHANNASFIVQEQLPLLRVGNRLSDIRMAMEKDGQGVWQASLAVLRLGKENLSVTHGANGGELYPLAEGLRFYVDDPRRVDELVKTVKDVSLLLLTRIEDSFGRMGEVALDLAFDQEFKLWLLEANAKPGKFTTRENKQAPASHRRILEYGRFLWQIRHR